MLEISALTDIAENINDDLWLVGNRNLLGLNLSSKKKNTILHFDFYFYHF
jgi:hypothetical protein